MDHSDHFTLTKQEVQSLIAMYENARKDLLDIAEKEKPLCTSNIINIRYAQHKAYANALKGRIDELTHLLRTL